MATQAFISPVTVNEDEIQGDVLIGLQKVVQCFAFLEIVDSGRFGSEFREILDDITSLRKTRIYEETHAGEFQKVNIAFSHSGLRKLGLVTAADEGQLDPSFVAGQMARAHDLGDDLSDWLPEYKEGRIDVVLLIAIWGTDIDGTAKLLVEQADAFEKALHRSTRPVARAIGRIRSGEQNGLNQKGHEHFGFADGVSQPGVKGLTKPNNPKNAGQGLPGQDLVEPGEFVFGHGYSSETSEHTDPPLEWMQNGSYLVFRRLRQDVPGFRQYVAATWTGRSSTPEQFATRMVGRWADGSALALSPDVPGDTSAAANNDFEFGPGIDPGNDPAQKTCPFSAHIRRMYPREDEADKRSEKRRILRAGIAFGRDDDADKGLLFVCYQASITGKFEAIQMLASTPSFAPDNPDKGGMTVSSDPGVDQVLASIDSPRTSHWDSGDLPRSPAFVTSTGGEYFFSPSMSALRSLSA